MRASIAYLTSTAATAAAADSPGAHRLDVLGYHRGERAVYLAEDVGAAAPVVHIVRTRGEQAGRMVAMRSWYERGTHGIHERLELLRNELVPMDALEVDPWCLTTRVVQRRALRLPDGGRPIRKFALQLTVEPVISHDQTVRARTVVTAYLRPRARLDAVWSMPGHPLALARVTYVGVPEGVGLDKQVAMLVSRELQ